jgi:hypothetical protein
VKKSRFTEEQIAFVLKQAGTGTPVAEVLRRMSISEQACLTLEEALHTVRVGPPRCGRTSAGRWTSYPTLCSMAAGCGS